jgi:hypothetical protein
MKKLNGCIAMISSRTKCIELCLKSLHEKFNHKHEYPVYVHYFDDIYSDENFSKHIKETIHPDITFIKVDYEIPSHIPEKELYYNRKDLWYVRQSFPPARLGYLHMCHFVSNMYNYPNTKIHNHDYMMMIDDESLFTSDLPYDPIEIIAGQEKPFGALRVYDQTKRAPHQGNFDTRVNLWNFIKDYLNKNSITPKSNFLVNLLEDPESDVNFHLYPIADSYVLKLNLFNTPEWNHWIKAVNEYGGIYKYRWGDNDIHSLFHHIYFDHDIYDFKTVDEGYHDQGGLRNIQNYAPGVKN